jgi:5-methylthioribose kinase
MWMEKHKPTTIEDIAKRWSVRKCGQGAFRRVYAVRNLDVVIKIPYACTNWWRSCAPAPSEGVKHARLEYKAWLRVMTMGRYRALKRYMPDIWYYDSRSGIVIMERYRKARASFFVTHIGCFIENIIEDLFNLKWELDLGADNLGIDRYGNFRLIDLGLIEERK